MSVYTKLACFAGGALFGSFGIQLLPGADDEVITKIGRAHV